MLTCVRQFHCENPEDVVDTVWTDYLGGTVYGDFTVVEDEGSPVYTDLNAFLPGIGRVDPHGTPSAVEYYHANQIGTTRAMTDNGGDDEQGVVYTAFGERVGGTDHRYGYAGAWGYRSHDDFACDAESPEYEFPYLHVGWRYYDPASGRFLQRDPIGISGGLNVYAYVSNIPTAGIDPMGQAFFNLIKFAPVVMYAGFWGEVWSVVKIVAGVVATGVGLILIKGVIVGTSPVWVAGVGLVLIVAGVLIILDDEAGVWPMAVAFGRSVKNACTIFNAERDNIIRDPENSPFLPGG